MGGDGDVATFGSFAVAFAAADIVMEYVGFPREFARVYRAISHVPVHSFSMDTSKLHLDIVVAEFVGDFLVAKPAASF